MKRFLLADDHAIIRYATRQLLEQAYPELLVAETDNGDELLRQALANDWDLVIADIGMPGISIFDCIMTIKKTKPSLPVLLLNQQREDLYAVRTLRTGGAGFVSKAESVGKLIIAVNSILSGRKYIPPPIAERLALSIENDENNQPHERLSDRELSNMRLLAMGTSLTDIADQLAIGVTTASTYRSRILTKMNLKSNADLLQYAISHQLLSISTCLFAGLMGLC